MDTRAKSAFCSTAIPYRSSANRRTAALSSASAPWYVVCAHSSGICVNGRHIGSHSSFRGIPGAEYSTSSTVFGALDKRWSDS